MEIFIFTTPALPEGIQAPPLQITVHCSGEH
jgi:hypothetical protein